MIRVRGISAPLGQQQAPALAHLSLCSLIPAQYIPGVRTAVERIGCDPASRTVLTNAIVQQYGGASAPWYQQMVAAVGPEVVAECICRDARYNPPAPTPQTGDGGGMSKWIVAGVVAAGVGAALYLKKRRGTVAGQEKP